MSFWCVRCSDFANLNIFVWPPLWSSGQSSWLQIQRSGFDSRSYQILWVVVGLKRGPLSLVSTIEKLLGRNSSGWGLENREYGRRDSSRWSRDTLYPQKLALSLPTSVGRYNSFADWGHGVSFLFLCFVQNVSCCKLDRFSFLKRKCVHFRYPILTYRRSW
jgi:hypothetical protein